MDISSMQKIKKLTDVCAECAGSLSGLILGNPQNIPERALQYHALESFGFIIAFLCYSGGIRLDEAGSCNACFIALAFGDNKDYFYKSSKAIDFYLRIFVKFEDSKEDFLKYSIIKYNLKRPQSWNDFNNGFPLGELDFFDVSRDTITIIDFLTNHLPKKINPILESMD